MKDYAAIATQYARDVVEGSQPACKWVRLAAQRHLDDLEKSSAGWRYVFNPEITRPARRDGDGNVVEEARAYRPADRACHFIELLPHIKDDFQQRAARGATIVLEPWQVFVIASIFGWVDRETNRRRFRIADLFVPRKNAKSTLAAAIGLYMAFVDGEHGAEVYSGATSEKQAGEVFNPARLMTERTPEFRARFGIRARKSNISCPANNSKFEPVVGNPGDGASPHCAIVDEYHEHPTEALYDTMRTGMLARSQPLMLVITTAGDDIASPCYAHQQELQQILEGLVEDDRRFGIIYTVDIDEDGKLEDWTQPEALVKANPNLGVSIDPETLLADQRDAVRDVRKQSTFQTKHLNIWVASANPWLPMQAWKNAGDKTLRLENFRAEHCWEGVDLANTTDIASRCKLFKRVQPTPTLHNPAGEIATLDQRREYDALVREGKPTDGWQTIAIPLEHYYYFWRHYLPEAIIEEPENKHYKGWHKAGWITATAGSMIDQGKIEADIVADSKRHPIKEVAFDPWGAPGIIGNLQQVFGEDHITTLPLQTRHLSAPMKWIDGLLRDGRLHHNADPVAAWAVNNVLNKADQNDNWFPRKQSRAKKTDPAVAMIIATARAMAEAPQEQFQVMVF